MSNDLLERLALYLPALFISLSVHEFAHAWTATRLGDDTAARQGRLTLSPLSHLDPIGSLALPLAGIVIGGGVFGYAKPVPFNPARFSRGISMRSGAALTALAGPMSNVLLAFLSLVILLLLPVFGIAPQASPTHEMAHGFLQAMFQLNSLLAVFNMLPVPPLDGGYLLPRSMDGFKERIAPYSIWVMLGLFMVPIPPLGGASIGGLVVHLLQTAILWTVSLILLPFGL